MGTRMITTNRTRALTLGVALLAASLLVLLLALFATKPAQAAFPGKNGGIAFDSGRDGASEIYSMRPDGTGVKRLTNNSVGYYSPVFSPDGTKIAFDSEGFNIYVMNADGTGVKRLTNDSGWDFDPAFSPDGAKIAFTSDRSGFDDIYVMNADGTGVKRLTDHENGDYGAVFSPDGKKIAFGSERSSWGDIYIMNADGTGVTNLTNGPWDNECGSPDFSPDGKKIAFDCRRSDGNKNIYVMNADGTGVTKLTSDSSWDKEPVFSPDGKKIAFTSGRSGNLEIYVMNADGTNVSRLTANIGQDERPNWGSDSIAPKGTISINGGKVHTKTPSVKLTLSARDSGSGVAGMRFRNDGQGWSNWEPGDPSKDWKLRDADGTRTVYVQYIDNAGNVSTTADRIKLDTVAPTTRLKSGPSGVTRSTTARFYFASPEAGVRFQCSLGRTRFTSCASPKTYKGLKDGWHRFRVRAVDAAGNRDRTPAYRNWRVDTIKPTIKRVSPPPGSKIRDRTPTIAATIKDTNNRLSKRHITLYVAGKKIRKNKFTYNRKGRMVYNSRKLSKGKKVVKVVARDRAGNRATKRWIFTIR